MKVAAGIVLMLLAFGCIPVRANVWLPSAGHAQIPIWPGKSPDSSPGPGPEYALTGHKLIGDKPVTGVFNVTRPTMTVCAALKANTGAAVAVFPGGGFVGLAIGFRRH